MFCVDDKEDYRTLPSGAAKSRLHELVPEFQPTQIIVDFEEASIAAVCAVFGNDVAVSGCWFHFAQVLVKRVRKLGLTDACQNDLHTQTVLRCGGVACLFRYCQLVTLIPHLTRSFLCWTTSRRLKRLMQQLIRYVSRQWLNS